MELYNEYKNIYFRAVTEVIYKIMSSETIHPENNETKELHIDNKKYISFYDYSGVFLNYVNIPGDNEILDKFNNFICAEILVNSKIFLLNGYPTINSNNSEIEVSVSYNNKELRKSDIKVSLTAEEYIPILPCLVEQQWLKNALNLPVADIFLDSNSKSKIIESLEDIPEIKGELFTTSKSTYLGDKINKKFISHIKTILTAIHENKTIIYSSKPNSCEPKYNVKSLPYLIEYSITEKKFRLIHYPFKDKRPVKSNISNFIDVKLGEEYHGKGTIKELVEGKKAAPLEFILFYRPDKPFISEKALLLFSKYERNISEDSEGNLIFTIEYYEFQERELLSEILSFGPYLEVRAPQAFRNKIIERLKMA